MRELLSLKRLLRDLREVLESPLPNVVAAPFESNVYVWHGNVRSAEGCLDGALIHFALHFPGTYPESAPEVRLFTPVPHPNVKHVVSKVPELRGADWRLAIWDCVPDHNSWSCAYSVVAVLVQLQAFLLHEELQYDNRVVTAEQATSLALAFSCSVCGHTHSTPHPPPPASSACHVSAPKYLPRPFVPTRSRQTAQVLVNHQKAVSSASAKRQLLAPSTLSSQVPCTSQPASISGGDKKNPEEAVSFSNGGNDKQAAVKPETTAAKVNGTAAADGGNLEEEWIEVKSKKSKNEAPVWKKKKSYKGKGYKKVQPPPSTSTPTSQTSATLKGHVALGLKMVNGHTGLEQPAQNGGSETYTGAFAVLEIEEESDHAEQPDQSDLGGSAAAAEDGTKVAGSGVKKLTKTAKKNYMRAMKRKAAKAEKTGEAETADGKAPTAQSGAAEAATSQLPSTSGSLPAQTAVALASGSSGAKQSTENGFVAVSKKKGQSSANDYDDEEEEDYDEGEEEEEDFEEVDAKKKAAPSAGVTKSLAAELADWAQAPLRKLIQDVFSERPDATWCTPLVSQKIPWGKPTEAASSAASASSKSRSAPVQQAAAVIQDSHPFLTQSEITAMSGFGSLPMDAMRMVLLELTPKEVGALGSTCKGLMRVCQDGFVWQAFMQREFPRSNLLTGGAGDWHHAFQMEAAAVVGDLQCFYTRTTFEEEVLGLPLRFTVNPMTKAVDYIEADSDPVCVRAVVAGAITRTAKGEAIQAVLPLYITAEHFSRALPYLPRLIPLLAPEKVGAGGKWPADVWLDIIPKIMNTCVVLLCDHGIEASQRALVTYASLHRLLLALTEHFNLWSEAAKRLDAFLASPKNRVKSATPNLGHLIPLLALSPRHTWQQVVVPLVNETFDRSVLWMCKADLSLADRLKAPHKQGEADEQLLESAFKGCLVGRRLLIFHRAFIHHVACPPNVPLEAVMDGADMLYGRPGPGVVSRFRKSVIRIMEMTTWDQFFTLVGLAAPKADYLTGWLRSAWGQSLAKGYHRKNTDFSKVQASGVSRILLKGQSYSTPPNLSQVKLDERWRWKPSSGTKFLDASMFLLNARGEIVDFLDYSHRHSVQTATPGAARHSGDVMDRDGCSGKHTIDVDLGKLGDVICTLVITMSAWAGATLADIQQPYVELSDPDTGVALCGYHLEDQQLSVRQAHSAVIMASLTRSVGRGGGGWKVTAIGTLSQGSASDYGPLQTAVKAAVRQNRA